MISHKPAADQRAADRANELEQEAVRLLFFPTDTGLNDEQVTARLHQVREELRPLYQVLEIDPRLNPLFHDEPID